MNSAGIVGRVKKLAAVIGATPGQLERADIAAGERYAPHMMALVNR
jgi:hypothetical protein